MLAMLEAAALAVGSHVWPVLSDAAIKSVALLVPAFVLTAILRRSSAAARHAVWLLAVVGLFALPVVSAVLPAWRILPGWLDMTPVTVVQTAPAANVPAVSARTPAPVVRSQPPREMTGMQRPAVPATAAPPPATPAMERSSLPAVSQLDRKFPLLAWAPLLWIAGTSLILGWLGLSFLSLRRLRRSCEPIRDESWTVLLDQLSNQLRLRGSIQLLQSPRRTMPMAWGIFRRRLLLPAEASQWPADRRRAVLLHELAHLKRRDLAAQLVTQIACAFYWFNPLVWIAARRMVTERERACDDVVLTAGPAPCDYAGHVLDIAAGLRSSPLVGAAAIAMARPSGLERRLLAILDDRRCRRALTRTTIALLVALFAGIILPVAMMRAMASEPVPTPKPERFVRLVVGFDRMTFEGMQTTWNDLPGLIKAVPDRERTILELAFTKEVAYPATPELEALRQDATDRATRLAQEYGFASLKDVGATMLGARGTLCFEAPFELNRDIPVALVAGTAERPDALQVHWIRFEMQGDQLIQKTDAALFSRPSSDWDFRTELIDEQGNVAGCLAVGWSTTSRLATLSQTGPDDFIKDSRPIGPEGLMGTNPPVRFVFRVSQRPTYPCSIGGTIVDATVNTSEECFAEFETAETEEAMGQVFQDCFGRRPASNVPVKLRGALVPMETTTDAEGHYEFPTLPCGEYELSAEMPSWPSRSGEERMATGKAVVDLSVRGPHGHLEVRADRITVTGRITDKQGQPVSGAKVIGIQEVHSETSEIKPNVVTTLSDADGHYELQGLNPPNVYNAAGYLAGGNGTGELGLASFYLLVRVDAEGFLQSRENIPRIPVVSEELLASARRLLKAMNRIQTRLQGSSEIREKEGVGPLPASRGNVITGIDVVLDRRPPLAYVSGQVVDTKGRLVQNRGLEWIAVRGAPRPPGWEYVKSDEPRGIVTDSDGRFEIPAMAPGKYSIIVYGPTSLKYRQIPIRGSTLDVKPGERVENFEIVLNPPEDFTVSGHVRDAKGNPVRGLFVWIGKGHEHPWWDSTDAEGAYHILGLDGIGETSFKIRFGYGGPAIPDVPLNAANVDIAIPDKGTIDGLVLDAETGEAIASYEIKVPIVRLAQGKAIWEEPPVEIEKRPDGTFRIADVPAGEATIEIRTEKLGTQQFTTRVQAGKVSALECVMQAPAASESGLPGAPGLEGAMQTPAASESRSPGAHRPSSGTQAH
ncbi:MAG: hypothetical protein JXB13_00935 [Phycisphaerae bacterium]|nr:hypothetical protein [Phycisphaerae bacterium]